MYKTSILIIEEMGVWILKQIKGEYAYDFQ